MVSKFSELVEEFRSVFSRNSKFLDSLLPLLVFLLLNFLFHLEMALWGSIITALIFLIYRLLKKQSLSYAFGGIGGVLIAVLAVQLLGGAEGFFLPGIISSAVIAVSCFLSVLVKRPLVAWTSFIARRFPLDWYWHPRVRPAYSEVTLGWGIFFALRLWLQLNYFDGESVLLLGLAQVLTGLPATIVLLAISYLYGLWRLRSLEGPSVKEFQAGSPSPWESQRRGF